VTDIWVHISKKSSNWRITY